MGRADTYLEAYIERLRPAFEALDDETAHAVTSALLRFKFGLYGNAAAKAAVALARLEGEEAPGALRTALQVLQQRADDLKASVPVSTKLPPFSEEERPFLAMDLPAGEVEDKATFTLDNALLLLYAVGAIASPDDEQALDEHRGFTIQILTSYRKQLRL
ncbi:hypothetical protein RJ40_10610 [Methanofollis aquaemaris]|uniref:Uncharacterized protein n=1 Tax=Methanofollis aquaemaris TaxID=126734 RepID=A0A8A3S7K3_9EURY|nr:hypothetical protein [Methanofollis aquaemaris]QSZ67913.1 hypothetical protein RJ40_10610 [Methanofollis aquaemaris]